MITTEFRKFSFFDVISVSRLVYNLKIKQSIIKQFKYNHFIFISNYLLQQLIQTHLFVYLCVAEVEHYFAKHNKRNVFFVLTHVLESE